ncbi:MAG TPA: suppressor of fused domain protein [Cytophaga sp.]|nr:suppressor of fused domain protein [Cytophaga sp.]
MTSEEYIKQFSEDEAPGWLAMDVSLEKLYPAQEPRHYASVIKYMMGGADPLDGTSIYDSQQQAFHRHIVSYGMSELYYAPDKSDKEFSNWGFEFTMRVKDKEGNEDPQWVIGLMNNLARYVFQSGNWFEDHHYIPANGPIKLNSSTDKVGILFISDPELGTIDTPHGKLTFLQMIGITEAQLERLKQHPEEGPLMIEEFRVNNPLFITDLNEG